MNAEDLCLSSLNTDFLDNILLGSDVVTTVDSTDIRQQECPVTDAHRTDHMYSRSCSDSASFSPPSVGSHASFYSSSTGSPPHGLENSSLSSPAECVSPLDCITEDLTVQGLLTGLEPTTVVLQGNDIIHMVTACDETITDDSGLISVGKCPVVFLLFLVYGEIPNMHWIDICVPCKKIFSAK